MDVVVVVVVVVIVVVVVMMVMMVIMSDVNKYNNRNMMVRDFCKYKIRNIFRNYATMIPAS